MRGMMAGDSSNGDVGKGVNHLTEEPQHSVFEEEEKAHQFFTLQLPRPELTFIAPDVPSTYCTKCNKGPASIAGRHQKPEFQFRHLYVHQTGFPIEKKMDYEAIFERFREQKEQRTQAIAEVPAQKRMMIGGHNGWIKNS